MSDAIQVEIVEDNKPTGEHLVGLLGEASDFYVKKWHQSSRSALAELDHKGTDLLILDIGLPDINGVELLKKIRKKNKHIRAVMFTVFEEEDLLLEAIEHGANGYLLKETEPELFLSELRMVCRGGISFTPRLAMTILDKYAAGRKKSWFGRRVELSEREIETLNYLAMGLKVKEIAQELEISIHTVKRHLENIYEKLQVNNKMQAVIKARRLGMLEE